MAQCKLLLNGRSLESLPIPQQPVFGTCHFANSLQCIQIPLPPIAQADTPLCAKDYFEPSIVPGSLGDVNTVSATSVDDHDNLFCELYDADDEMTNTVSSLQSDSDIAVDDGAGLLKWLCWGTSCMKVCDENGHEPHDVNASVNLDDSLALTCKDELSYHIEDELEDQTSDEEIMNCRCCKRSLE